MGYNIRVGNSFKHKGKKGTPLEFVFRINMKTLIKIFTMSIYPKLPKTSLTINEY